MNLEDEVKKLLEEGYSESDILEACKKAFANNSTTNMVRLFRN